MGGFAFKGLCYNLWHENRGKKICKRSSTFSSAYATEPDKRPLLYEGKIQFKISLK